MSNIIVRPITPVKLDRDLPEPPPSGEVDITSWKIAEFTNAKASEAYNRMFNEDKRTVRYEDDTYASVFYCQGATKNQIIEFKPYQLYAEYVQGDSSVIPKPKYDYGFGSIKQYTFDWENLEADPISEYELVGGIETIAPSIVVKADDINNTPTDFTFYRTANHVICIARYPVSWNNDVPTFSSTYTAILVEENSLTVDFQQTGYTEGLAVFPTWMTRYASSSTNDGVIQDRFLRHDKQAKDYYDYIRVNNTYYYVILDSRYSDRINIGFRKIAFLPNGQLDSTAEFLDTKLSGANNDDLGTPIWRTTVENVINSFPYQINTRPNISVDQLSNKWAQVVVTVFCNHTHSDYSSYEQVKFEYVYFWDLEANTIQHVKTKVAYTTPSFNDGVVNEFDYDPKANHVLFYTIAYQSVSRKSFYKNYAFDPDSNSYVVVQAGSYVHGTYDENTGNDSTQVTNNSILFTPDDYHVYDGVAYYLHFSTTALNTFTYTGTSGSLNLSPLVTYLAGYVRFDFNSKSIHWGRSKNLGRTGRTLTQTTQGDYLVLDTTTGTTRSGIAAYNKTNTSNSGILRIYNEAIIENNTQFGFDRIGFAGNQFAVLRHLGRPVNFYRNGPDGKTGSLVTMQLVTATDIGFSALDFKPKSS